MMAASGAARGASWASGDDGLSSEKIAKVAPNVMIGSAGLSGDARLGYGRARRTAVSHWLDYGRRPTVSAVADALGDLASSFAGFDALFGKDGDDEEPVSYTHLTLPTIYSV